MATPAPFLLSLFPVFPPPLVFLIFPHHSLWLSCFHTPFSMLSVCIPTVENSACFIWKRKQRANIACLYPLAGIMATITHWFSTKTDKLLFLCWQTTAHYFVNLFFSPGAFHFFSLCPYIFVLICLPTCTLVNHGSLIQGGIKQQGKCHDPWRLLQKWK